MTAEILHLPIELPYGLSNLEAHAFQEWEAAGKAYDLAMANWDSLRPETVERARAARERRRAAWERYWGLRGG